MSSHTPPARHRTRVRPQPSPAQSAPGASQAASSGAGGAAGAAAAAEAAADAFDLAAAPYVAPEERLSSDIGVRTRQVARMHGEYVEEFVLQTLSQLLHARVPKDQIAQRFGVTVRTIYTWERKLYAKLRDEAKKLDPVSFLGESLEFYEFLRAQGVAMHLTGATLRERIIGLVQARNAHNDMHKFLHLAGFYEQVKFPVRAVENDDPRMAAANEMARRAQDMFLDLDKVIDLDPDPVSAADGELLDGEPLDGELVDVGPDDDGAGDDA